MKEFRESRYHRNCVLLQLYYTYYNDLPKYQFREVESYQFECTRIPYGLRNQDAKLKARSGYGTIYERVYASIYDAPNPAGISDQSQLTFTFITSCLKLNAIGVSLTEKQSPNRDDH
ncbi:hypothetical protein ACS0PU_009841 [Formica fusca]